ncbi:MAG: flippase [Deltaproteobacteria bacterium]|nr:flippase [Deltaproteobacteria bacterium]
MLKIAKGAGTSLLGSIIGRSLWFLCQVLIARFLGANVFGLYILGLGVLKITELFSRLGLHVGAMRFVAIYHKSAPERIKGILISVSTISFITGTLVGGLVYLAAGMISVSLFHKPELTAILKTFSICIPFMSTMMVVATTTRGFHTAKYYVYIADLAQPVVNTILVIISISLGLGVIGLIKAFIISYIISLLVAFYLLVKEFPAIITKSVRIEYDIRTLLLYSFPLMLSGLLMFLVRWTDTIMLGLMKQSADVGIYRAASQIPIFLGLILTAINSVYAPTIAQIHHQNEKERLEKILKTTTRWIFLFTFPLVIILAFSSREIISVFGNEFIAKGAPVLIIITLAQFINCITGGVGIILGMTGKQNMLVINSAVLVLVNILLNVIFIPIYGCLGAAIASGISIAGVNILRLIEVYFFYRIHPYNPSYFLGIMSGIISIIILEFTTTLIHTDSNLITLLINTSIVLLCFILLYIHYADNEDDKFIITAIAGRLNHLIPRND